MLDLPALRAGLLCTLQIRTLRFSSGEMKEAYNRAPGNSSHQLPPMGVLLYRRPELLFLRIIFFYVFMRLKVSYPGINSGSLIA